MISVDRVTTQLSHHPTTKFMEHQKKVLASRKKFNEGKKQATKEEERDLEAGEM